MAEITFQYAGLVNLRNPQTFNYSTGSYGIVAPVKRRDLIRHLEENGCLLVREGRVDTVYFNPSMQRTSTVPRHREVKNPTAIRICKQLGVPDPLH